MKHLVVCRGRFKDKDLRDEYYKMARKYLAPSLAVQSNKDFIFCLLTCPEDIEEFNRQVGIEGLHFNDREGIDEFARHNAAEIITRHDIDDWMAPNYIEEIQKAYWQNRERYKNFLIQVNRPIKLIDETGEERPMKPYHDTWPSMFLSICRGIGGRFISIFDRKHGKMFQVADAVIDLPPGLTKWVRHPAAVSETK